MRYTKWMNSKIVDLFELSFEVKDLRLVLGNKTILEKMNTAFSGPGLVLIEGENGSGKSSFLKVLAGFTTASSGIVNIQRKEFSFLTTSSLGLLNDFTGNEHIKMINSSLNVNEQTLQHALEKINSLEIFQEILEKKVCDMSQGMKQILRLFLHLYFRPKVIFLDEPFLYLSPKIKEFFQFWIENLASDSLVFITDQRFSWAPATHFTKIYLGKK